METRPIPTSQFEAGRYRRRKDANIAFGIARSDLAAWKDWLNEQGFEIELRKTWKYGGEALYFRDPDGHLLEVVTPGVWNIY